MTASGHPPGEIIAAIRSAEAVAFDLDPEIIIELRRAKVVDSVIRAMQEVSETKEPPPPAEPEPTGTLLLTFEDDKRKDPMRSTIGVPAHDEKDNPLSLALFLLCEYPTHVPDLWQEHTTLLEYRRHRLHLLHQETTERKLRGTRVVLLDRPEGMTLPLPAGTHNLVLGAAIRTGELPWLPIVEDLETVVIDPDRTTTLTIRLSTRTSVRRMSGNPFIIKIVSATQEPQAP